MLDYDRIKCDELDEGELNQLLHDADWYTNRCIAENPHTSEEILIYLFTNTFINCKYRNVSNYVKYAASINNNFPEELKNCKDEDWWYFQNSIYKRASCKEETCYIVMERDFIKENDFLTAAKTSKDSRILNYLSTYLAAGRKDVAADVRKAVAENENTPLEILQKLSTDNYVKVRIAVAKNKNTSFRILNELLKDFFVKETVEKHSNISLFL